MNLEKNYLTSLPSGFVLPYERNLGSAGMFIGVLSAFVAVEVYRFTQELVQDFNATSVPASVTLLTLTPTW